MTVPLTTIALDRPVPLVLRRSTSSTVRWPLRYGSGAALVEVVEAGSTWTMLSPSGASLVAAAALSVVSGIAQATYTAASTVDLGEGYQVDAKIVLASGGAFEVREQAIVVQYLPPCTVSEATLYKAWPELEHRVPQSQGPRGSGVGWQPQIDAAYEELIRRLLSDSRTPWTIVDAVGAHDWLLARAVQNCTSAITYSPDSPVGEAAKNWSFRARAADGALRFIRESAAIPLREAATPAIRLAPLRSW